MVIRPTAKSVCEKQPIVEVNTCHAANSKPMSTITLETPVPSSKLL